MNLSVLVRQRPRLFFGWWMVALGGFLTSLNKTAVNKGFPVFILPVEEAFGANRATVSFIFSLARAETGPTGPLAGWLVDRFGPRALLFLGATMSGGGFLILAWAPNIWAFALVYLGLVTMGSNIGFSYSMAALINNWFFRRKALAMSAFQGLDTVVPATLVPVVALSIAIWGLRPAFLTIGIVLLAVILPLAFMVKDTPESMGLTMDGDPPAAPEGTEPGRANRPRAWQPPKDYSVTGAMRTPSYWVLVAATALRLIAKAAVVLHIIPIIVSKGTDAATAAFIFGLLLFITVPLYLLVGWLADRLPKNWVLTGAAVSGTASFVLLASPISSLGIIFAFVFLFSIAEASAPTNWAVLGEYFGRKTFSQLRGYVQFANFPGVLAAPVFVGWWYDHNASYTLPLWIFAAVFGLSALTFAVMRRPKVAAEEVVKIGPV